MMLLMSPLVWSALVCQLWLSHRMVDSHSTSRDPCCDVSWLSLPVATEGTRPWTLQLLLMILKR